MQSTTTTMSSSASSHDTQAYHEFSAAEIIAWFAIYGVIAFLAVSGNALVVYVVATRKKLQNVPNYFIVNLAVADLLTGLIAVPFKFQAALLQRWTLPNFMCPLLTFTETLSLSVSVFTLTGSAVDRFIVVIVPNRPKMSKGVAIAIIVCIWVFSVACSLPFGAFHEAGAINPMTGEELNSTMIETMPSSLVMWRCMPIYMASVYWRYYNVYLTIIQYFIPLIIVDSAYCIIAYRVWITEPSGDQRFMRDRRKVVKLLVIVVTLFTFCWLPYETYLLLSEVAGNINHFYWINLIFMLCHCLAMSNSCINPIIYGVYNKKFQREYRRLFYRWCGLADANGHRYRTPADDPHRSSRNGRRSGRRLEVKAEEEHTPNSTHNFITSELGR